MGGERVFLGHLSSLFSSLWSLQHSTGVAWGEREGRSGTGGNTLICGDGLFEGRCSEDAGVGGGGGAVSQTQDMYKFACRADGDSTCS